MAIGDKIKWEDADFAWDLAPTDPAFDRYTWDEVLVVGEVALVFEGDDPKRLETLEEKKKKRIIHLVMRRNGIKMYDEMKEVKNITAYAKDIEIIIKEAKSNVQIIH